MADTGGPAGGSAGAGAGAGDAGEEGGGYSDADVGAGYGASSGSTGTADPGGGGPMGSAGASGSGVHDGSPGSVSDADGAAAYAGLKQGINAAIAAGLDPYSSKAQNVIAAGIMSGQFGNPESFGINVDMEAPEVAGFMDQYGPGQSSGLAGIAGLVGYNPDIGFMQNIANMAIPGRNTPLGALSAVPGLVGASNTVSGIVGLANTIAGKLGIASTTNPSAPDTALSGSVVGKGSIAGSYGANTGIASGPKF
jgi:hypothetical protein